MFVLGGGMDPRQIRHFKNMEAVGEFDDHFLGWFFFEKLEDLGLEDEFPVELVSEGFPIVPSC